MAEAFELAETVEQAARASQGMSFRDPTQAPGLRFDSPPWLPNQGHDTAPPFDQGPVPMGLNAMAATETSRTPLTDQEREALRDVDGCFYCREPHSKHWASDCPVKMENQIQWHQQQQSGQRRDPPGNGWGRGR